VREQLLYKFGREFAQAAMDNTFGTVNSRVVDKLRIEVPAGALVDSYLAAIAKAYKVAWEGPVRPVPLAPVVPGKAPHGPEVVMGGIAGAGAMAAAAEGPSPLTKHKRHLVPESPAGSELGGYGAGYSGEQEPEDGPPAFQSNPNLALAAAGRDEKGLPPTPRVGESGSGSSSSASASAAAPRAAGAEPNKGARAPSQAPSTSSSQGPDFDALSARFEALKRRA
jgi:hypothetical protein